MPESKRTFWQIRSIIQDALAKRPMNLWEICQECNLTVHTAKKHLQYLEDVGVVKRTVYKIRGKGEVVLWSLRKEEI